MAEYVLFYSWQSDEKRARNLIEKSLKRVVEKFKKSGINLILSQDSRGQKGAQNISMGILKLINKANMFLADLTPVTSYTGKEGLKLCPNSNVMFEYGYAMRALGEDRCTQYVFLKKDWNMALMPFDINQRTTLLLKEADLEDANEPGKKGERNTKFIEIQLKWEMNSRNYSNDGTLTIKSEPIYEDEYIESDENANTTKYCEKVRYL